MQRLVVFLALILGLAGCASPERKPDKPVIAEIQDGVSTEQDVERMLGLPRRKDVRADGKSEATYTTFQSDLPTDAPPGNVVPPEAAGSDSRRHLRQRIICVLYDRDGRVEEHRSMMSDTGFTVVPIHKKLGPGLQPEQLKFIVINSTSRDTLIRRFGDPVHEHTDAAGQRILNWLVRKKDGSEQFPDMLDVVVTPAGIVSDFRIRESFLVN